MQTVYLLQLHFLKCKVSVPASPPPSTGYVSPTLRQSIPLPCHQIRSDQKVSRSRLWRALLFFCRLSGRFCLPSLYSTLCPSFTLAWPYSSSQRHAASGVVLLSFVRDAHIAGLSCLILLPGLTSILPRLVVGLRNRVSSTSIAAQTTSMGPCSPLSLQP
jgi:hypothetical protein